MRMVLKRKDRPVIHSSNIASTACEMLSSIYYNGWLYGKSVRLWCDGSSDRSFMVDLLSYFSFQPVFHDWCNKDRGMCYPVCGMMHIKEPLLVLGNVMSVSLNKTIPSLFHYYSGTAS